MLKDANNANNAHNTLALCALLTSFSMTHCLTLPTDTREQDEKVVLMTLFPALHCYFCHLLIVIVYITLRLNNDSFTCVIFRLRTDSVQYFNIEHYIEVVEGGPKMRSLAFLGDRL